MSANQQQEAARILFAIEVVALRDPKSPELERLVDEARALGASDIDHLRRMSQEA